MPRTILAAALALFLPLLPVPAQDWPQYLGPTRNNVSPERNILTTLPEGGIKPSWQVKLTTGHGGASVYEGLVYLLDGRKEVVEEKKGEEGEGKAKKARPRVKRWEVLLCLTLAEGKELWRREFPEKGRGIQMAGPRSQPAVTHNHLVVTGQYGEVRCLRRVDGEVLWEADLVGDFGSSVPEMWGVCQSPLIYGDTVILQPFGKKAGLVAFELKTGRIRWRTGELGKPTLSSPILAHLHGLDQVLAVGALSEKEAVVVAVEAATGKGLWRHPWKGTGWVVPGPTPVGEDRVFLTGKLGGGSCLIKVEKGEQGFTTRELFQVKGTLDPRSPKGKRIMKEPEYASFLHQPLLVGDHFYFVSVDNDNAEGLVCMDMTGGVKWHTGRRPTIGHGDYLLAAGRLFLFGQDGFLRIIDPHPGEYREVSAARVGPRGYNWAPLTLARGQLLVRSMGRRGASLFCLDLRRGKGPGGKGNGAGAGGDGKG